MKILTLSILRLTSCLGLVALYTPALEAQTPTRRVADTLRRELTVHTEEAVQLSERKALPLNLIVSSLDVSKAPTKPLTTTLPLGKGSSLSPLSGLSPLVGGFRLSPYRGYVHLAGGLETLGMIRAGYRPIASDEAQLDLYGSGLYSRFSPYVDLFDEAASQERQVTLQGNYQRKLVSGMLSVGAYFKHHNYNYYGAEVRDDFYVQGKGLSPALQQLLVQDRQTNNSFTASVGLASLEDANSSLDYALSAKIGYTHSTQPQLLAEQRASISEIFPELEGRASWRLSGIHHLGAKLHVSSLIYSRDLSERLLLMYPNSGNKTTFDVSPYWQMRDLSWGAANVEIGAGLGLTNYSRLEGSAFFLWPYLDFLISMPRVGVIRAELDGGSEVNSLASMAEQMPYRTRGVIPEVTRHRLRGRLSMTGELSRSMRMELYVSHAHREQDLNWGVQHHRILTPHRPSVVPELQAGASPLEGLGLSAIEFALYYTDTHQTTLGANLVYNYNNLWRAKVDLAFHKYGTSSDQIVSGRPRFVLNASYEYTPSNRLSLVAGYELRSGISYWDLSLSKLLEMDSLHLLKAGVTYTITPRISVQGTALWMPNSKSSLYYGHRMRQTTALLGINVNI